MTDALAYRWNDAAGAFQPVERFRALAHERFADGAAYWLDAEPVRSEKTHKHEFAWLREAWKNLPEHLAEQFPSSEHLRKRALIDAGFYTEQVRRHTAPGDTNCLGRTSRSFGAADQYPLVVAEPANARRSASCAPHPRSSSVVLLQSASVGLAERQKNERHR